VAGTLSLPGDTPKDDSKATPVPRTLPRTGERCKRCPPDAGFPDTTTHDMTPAARRYQGYVTGRPYGVGEGRRGWNEEWKWNNTDWDGFVPEECVLQEAKGNYDIFFEPWAKNTDAFRDMQKTAFSHAAKVRANPPTRIRWYFQTPKTYELMEPLLKRYSVESEFKPWSGHADD
jgi:hypothetical protein